MANALALTAATAASAIAGLKAGGNTNGNNSMAWTFANGAPGAADTIANAQLLTGIPTTSRLYSFLNTSYATQAALDATAAALGLMLFMNSASAPYLTTAAPGKPTMTCTTAAAVGTLRISLAASQTA